MNMSLGTLEYNMPEAATIYTAEILVNHICCVEKGLHIVGFDIQSSG